MYQSEVRRWLDAQIEGIYDSLRCSGELIPRVCDIIEHRRIKTMSFIRNAVDQ